MEASGRYLDQMRATAPLVHNITNYVAKNIMANVLLAAGATPATVHALDEVTEFAALAQALSVNNCLDVALATGAHGLHIGQGDGDRARPSRAPALRRAGLPRGDHHG